MRLSILLPLGAALCALSPALPSSVAPARALAQGAAQMPDTTKMSHLELMAWRARNTDTTPVKEVPAALPLPAGVTRLTESPGQDKEPSWSPDGSSLFYTYEEGGHSVIRRIDLDGGAVETVTDTLWTARMPDISPSGKHLAYGRETHDFGMKLWIQRLEDGENAKLTPAMDDGRELYPRWSQSGMQIYFERTNPASMDSPALSISRDGQNEEVLITGRGMHTRPAVSRSGKKVAWVNRLGKDTGLRIMDAKVSAIVESYELPGHYIASLDWLPGPEDQGLVLSWLDEDEPLKGYSLGLYDLKTRELTPFLDLGPNDLDPRVSPDGKRLAFSANREGNYELYVYELP